MLGESSNAHERTSPAVQELKDLDAELIRNRLTDLFDMNLEQFMSGNIEQKVLVLLKFLEGKSMVSFKVGDYEYGFQYGSLKEKFEALFEDQRDKAFQPTTYAKTAVMEASEHLATGLEELVGKEIRLVTTTYPLKRRRGNEGISITQEEYNDNSVSLRSSKRFEVWTARKIHFSNSSSDGDNSDRRLKIPVPSVPNRTPATHLL